MPTSGLEFYVKLYKFDRKRALTSGGNSSSSGGSSIGRSSSGRNDSSSGTSHGSRPIRLTISVAKARRVQIEFCRRRLPCTRPLQLVAASYARSAYANLATTNKSES